MIRPGRLRHPIREKQIRLARLCVVPVGCPHERPPIGAEHRESIETRVGRDLFERRPVNIHEVEIEIAAARLFVVRRKDQPPAIWRPRRPKVGAAEVCDLALVTSVGVHDPQFHPVRTHQALCQQTAVRGQ